jgi:hypothetical protein
MSTHYFCPVKLFFFFFLLLLLLFEGLSSLACSHSELI